MSENEKKIDVLLELYKQNDARAIHHQEQRSTVANLLLVLAGGLIALITVDQKIEHADLAPAGLLLLVGLFGAFWSAKQHERFAFYNNRAEEHWKEITRRLGYARLERLLKVAALKTKKEYPLLYRLRVWSLWVTLYFLIAGIGAWLAVEAWRDPRPRYEDQAGARRGDEPAEETKPGR